MNIEAYQHHHNFQSLHKHGQKRSWQVLILTLVVMVVEIVAGSIYGSMALLADGWHMSTHAVAFIIVLVAYHYAHRHADSSAFSFGTGKFSVLGGFASAVALAVVALMMFVESLHRMVTPEVIQFNEALGVAGLGLLVNLASVFILKTPHEHHHHGHDHQDHHAAHDHNLRAAYLHVMADALTSVLAIVALLLGKYFGWNWLDSAVGMVGAVVIARWAYGLLKDTAPLLLDASGEERLLQAIREAIEQDDTVGIADLHVWRVGPKHFAVVLSLVTETPRSPDEYKAQLEEFTQLAHVTVEVNPV
jgi:cation diffusion facilitator family transporter